MKKVVVGIPKTKIEIALEQEFKEINLEFLRVEKRLNKKDYLIYFKFKDDEHFTLVDFTLEFNQKLNSSVIYKAVFKELSI